MNTGALAEWLLILGAILGLIGGIGQILVGLGVL